MINRKIKHSILMVSYNQEDLISEAFDSVLTQNPLPYEIIISDDASTDKTWDIILSYQRKYPNIIKAMRNEINLGVYGNYNKVLKSATGDVVSWLSGDDYYRPGLLAELDTIIGKNEIDLDNERFVIITNFELAYPNGRSFIYDNFQLKDRDIFKERLRYGIFYRLIGVSRNVIEKIDFAHTGVGIHADWLLELDVENNCEKFYFTPFVSSTYRAGVGIVSKSKSIEMYNSRLVVIDAIKEKYANRIDSKDLEFLDYEIALNNYLINDDFHTYFKLWFYYLRNLSNFPVNNKAYSRERLLTLLPPKCRNILKSIRNYIIRRNITRD